MGHAGVKLSSPETRWITRSARTSHSSSELRAHAQLWTLKDRAPDAPRRGGGGGKCARSASVGHTTHHAAAVRLQAKLLLGLCPAAVCSAFSRCTCAPLPRRTGAARERARCRWRGSPRRLGGASGAQRQGCEIRLGGRIQERRVRRRPPAPIGYLVARRSSCALHRRAAAVHRLPPRICHSLTPASAVARTASLILPRRL